MMARLKRPPLERFLTSGLETVIDTHFDLYEVARLRACSRGLRALFAPAARPRLWGALSLRYLGPLTDHDVPQFIPPIEAVLRLPLMTPASANALRREFGLRAYHFRGLHLVSKLIKAAIESDDTSMVNWYVATFGIAGMANLTRSDVQIYITNAIGNKKLHTAEYLSNLIDEPLMWLIHEDQFHDVCICDDDSSFAEHFFQLLRTHDPHGAPEQSFLWDACDYGNPNVAAWCARTFRHEREEIDNLITFCIEGELDATLTDMLIARFAPEGFQYQPSGVRKYLLGSTFRPMRDAMVPRADLLVEGPCRECGITGQCFVECDYA